jgi:hypothetical protein
VPDLVLGRPRPEIGLREPDQEVQELLKARPGLNLGMDFLPGSVGYDGVRWQPPAAEAAAVHWLDAFTANVDRTWRNPNLLVWHRSCGRSTTARRWSSSTRGRRSAWAERRYDLSEHVLAPVVAGADPPSRRRRPRLTTRSPASCSRRSSTWCPTPGCSA